MEEEMEVSGEEGTLAMDSDPVRSTRKQKYNFRTTSVINRLEVEKRKQQPRAPKPKSRPPPLSKYRRKTANARERERMQEVNDAFETLRAVIPQYPAEKGKMTKITTLNLALNYIKALREVLGYRAGQDLQGDFSTPSSSTPSVGSEQSGGEFVDSGGLSSPSQASGSGLDSEGECFSAS